MSKIEVGTHLYLKPINNKARYGNVEIKDVEVTKVGRKYFEVDGLRRTKFYIDNLQEVTEYAADWKIYFSKQEIQDEYEFEELASELRRVLRGYGKIDLTLDQLRRIKDIVSE